MVANLDESIVTVAPGATWVYAPMICVRCNHGQGSGQKVEFDDPPTMLTGFRRCEKCGDNAAFPKLTHYQTHDGRRLLTLEAEDPRRYSLHDMNLAAIQRMGELAAGVIKGDDPRELLDHLETGPKPLRRLRSRFPKTHEGRVLLAQVVFGAAQLLTLYAIESQGGPDPALVEILDRLVEQQEAGELEMPESDTDQSDATQRDRSAEQNP